VRGGKNEIKESGQARKEVLGTGEKGGGGGERCSTAKRTEGGKPARAKEKEVLRAC